MATDTVFEGGVGFDGALEKDRESARVVKVWTSAPILFSDLGSGATDSIAVTGAGGVAIPGDIVFHGMVAKADPEFTGEADLVFEVGFVGGDTDALIASTALHETGAGDRIAVIAGAIKGGEFIPAATMADLAVLFTATELDDVTAGSLVLELHYVDADES